MCGHMSTPMHAHTSAYTQVGSTHLSTQVVYAHVHTYFTHMSIYVFIRMSIRRSGLTRVRTHVCTCLYVCLLFVRALHDLHTFLYKCLCTCLCTCLLDLHMSLQMSMRMPVHVPALHRSVRSAQQYAAAPPRPRACRQPPWIFFLINNRDVETT